MKSLEKEKNEFDIISAKEENGLLLIKIKFGDEFRIYLFENLTIKNFVENESIIDFQIQNNIKYAPIAQFCNSHKGWLIGDTILKEL